MTAPATCPRCPEQLQPPTLMRTGWHCPAHGPVQPYRVVRTASAGTAARIAGSAQVPLWAPSPLPPGWSVTGFGHAGDEKSGARATVVACAGPSPVGGPVDLLCVAEEPGIGLGARYAGLVLDIEPSLQLPPTRRIRAGDRQCPLWAVDTADDRVALVGEADGVWLWLVMWPSDADLVLSDGLALADLRGSDCTALTFGAAGPYLATG